MRNFQTPGRSAIYASNGICATSHPLAAKVAIEILESGGNAVDAAIAGAVLLGLCEPQMTGIGGDCFVLIKPAESQQVLALNGSGRAPKAYSAQAMRDRGLAAVPLRGVEPVTIPGAGQYRQRRCRPEIRRWRWQRRCPGGKISIED